MFGREIPMHWDLSSQSRPHPRENPLPNLVYPDPQKTLEWVHMLSYLCNNFPINAIWLLNFDQKLSKFSQKFPTNCVFRPDVRYLVLGFNPFQTWLNWCNFCNFLKNFFKYSNVLLHTGGSAPRSHSEADVAKRTSLPTEPPILQILYKLLPMQIFYYQLFELQLS